MRKNLAATITRLTEKNKNIYLVTGDTGFKVFDDFKEKFPHNYLNSGLCEAAMTGLAAGMAIQGKTVFTYGIAPFVTLRCLEQIKLDICYQNLPVIITGVGQGIIYGASGPTHHAITDISCMSAMPNITVICPADPIEAGQAGEALVKQQTPAYLRLGKTGEPNLYTTRPEFQIGKAVKMSIPPDTDIAICATGNMVERALIVKNILSVRGFTPSVYNFHTIKPMDNDCLLYISKTSKLIVTMEEHNIFNGFGAIIASKICEFNKNCEFLKIGIEDIFPENCGSYEWMTEKLALSPNIIAEKIELKYLNL
jgi:transketolase